MIDLELIPVSDITESHLQSLIDNQVAESRTLEFKAAAVGSSDGEKREFLKDLTAMANTAGGLLIYGMVEDDGVAGELKSLAVASLDDECLRLQSLLMQSVQPRITGTEMHAVPLAAGGFVLVVKVPQSWRPPHRVTHGGVNRFYLRHGSGVFEPDTEELRSVFNSGLEQERQLEAFRQERLERLRSGERGVLVPPSGKLLIQVVSLARGQPDFVIPEGGQCTRDFMPPGNGGLDYRHNFDGLLLFAPNDTKGFSQGYTQIFRNWKIEMARGDLIVSHGDTKYLRPSIVVWDISMCVERSLTGMVKFGAIGPFAVMVTLDDIEKSCLGAAVGYQREKVDRDVLRFPAIITDGNARGVDLQRELLPIWDGIWQAYGFQNCHLCRERTGEWRGFSPEMLR